MGVTEFWSPDCRFGLRLSWGDIRRIRALCTRAEGNETGGILTGFYTPRHDCACVTGVTGPPRDSRTGATWFHRGIVGLQHLLDRLWSETSRYYLGEWHFHPGASPEPSSVDIAQLRRIAVSPEYRCPEPVLLIIGGGPPLAWSLRTYVFPKHQEPLEMFKSGEVPSGGDSQLMDL